ncbi:MAG TPA: hypothetical protein VGC26_05450 [Afipia sp.]
MTIDVNERDQTARKHKKINASAFFSDAHNGLVAGSSPAGPTNISKHARRQLRAYGSPMI